MIKLIDSGFKWYSKNNISVIGYIFVDGYIKKDLEFVEFVQEYIENSKNLGYLLNNINGFFSIVINEKDRIILCCDKVRSLPLFYYNRNNKINITNVVNEILQDEMEYNKESIEEFTYTGYVTGNKTLIKSLKQVQAGEIIEIYKENNKVISEIYYEYSNNEELKIDKKELLDIIDDTYINTFKRLIESVEGKPIVVPLSGGYDSRIIVQMLWLLNYKDVICFSYGKINNREAVISEKIANHFNYKWVFVEYIEEEIKEIYNSKIMNEYSIFASNYSSLSCIQDFFAVKKLAENNLIPKESIIVPGHSGDFLAGSHIKKVSLQESDDIENNIHNIINCHYNLYNNCKKDLIKQTICKDYFLDSNRKVEYRLSQEEIFNWRERQAKFIINSIRLYEFFGFEWRLPLWDSELMDLWCKINFKHRYNRKLYKEYAKDLENKQLLYIDDNNISTNNLGVLGELKKYIKRISILKHFKFIKVIKEYNNDPLSLNKIFNKKEYMLYAIKGAVNINSILVDKYLKLVLRSVNK